MKRIEEGQVHPASVALAQGVRTKFLCADLSFLHFTTILEFHG